MPDLSVKLGVGMAVNLLEVDYIRPVEYPEVSCQVELSGYIAEERTGLCQKLEVIYMRACYLYDPESDGVIALSILCAVLLLRPVAAAISVSVMGLLVSESVSRISKALPRTLILSSIKDLRMSCQPLRINAQLFYHTESAAHNHGKAAAHDPHDLCRISAHNLGRIKGAFCGGMVLFTYDGSMSLRAGCAYGLPWVTIPD